MSETNREGKKWLDVDKVSTIGQKVKKYTDDLIADSVNATLSAVTDLDETKQEKLTGKENTAIVFGSDEAPKNVPVWCNPNLLKTNTFFDLEGSSEQEWTIGPKVVNRDWIGTSTEGTKGNLILMPDVNWRHDLVCYFYAMGVAKPAEIPEGGYAQLYQDIPLEDLGTHQLDLTFSILVTGKVGVSFHWVKRDTGEIVTNSSYPTLPPITTPTISFDELDTIDPGLYTTSGFAKIDALTGYNLRVCLTADTEDGCKLYAVKLEYGKIGTLGYRDANGMWQLNLTTPSSRELENVLQKKLTGTVGQIVSIDENGNAVAIDLPHDGTKQDKLVGRYGYVPSFDKDGNVIAIERHPNVNYLRSSVFKDWWYHTPTYDLFTDTVSGVNNPWTNRKLTLTPEKGTIDLQNGWFIKGSGEVRNVENPDLLYFKADEGSQIDLWQDISLKDWPLYGKTLTLSMILAGNPIVALKQSTDNFTSWGNFGGLAPGKQSGDIQMNMVRLVTWNPHPDDYNVSYPNLTVRLQITVESGAPLFLSAAKLEFGIQSTILALDDKGDFILLTDQLSPRDYGYAAKSESEGSGDQPTITGNEGQTIGFNREHNPVAVPVSANQSYIANGDFRYVQLSDDYYSSEITPSETPNGTLHYWKIIGTGGKCQDSINDGYELKPIGDGGYITIYQDIPLAQFRLYPNLVTFSILTTGSGKVSFKKISKTGTISSVTGWPDITINGGPTKVLTTVTRQFNTAGEYTFRIEIKAETATGDLGIHAIKLEVGENQTLAYRDENDAWEFLDQPLSYRELPVSANGEDGELLVMNNIGGVTPRRTLNNENLVRNADLMNPATNSDKTTFDIPIGSNHALEFIPGWTIYAANIPSGETATVSLGEDGVTITRSSNSSITIYMDQIIGDADASWHNRSITGSIIGSGQFKFAMTSGRYFHDDSAVSHPNTTDVSLLTKTWKAAWSTNTSLTKEITVRISMPASASGGYSCTIKAVKLEFGEIQTLGYYENGELRSQGGNPLKLSELVKVNGIGLPKASDSMIAFNSEGTLAATNMTPAQNILPNGDWQHPLQTLGPTGDVTNEANGITDNAIDGWQFGNEGTMSLTSEGIKLTATGGANPQLKRLVKNWWNPSWAGRNVTVSVVYKGSGYIRWYGVYQEGEDSARYLSPSAEFKIAYIVLKMPTEYADEVTTTNFDLRIQVYKTSQYNELTIKAVKAEFGDHQTLARVNEDGAIEILDYVDPVIDTLRIKGYPEVGSGGSETPPITGKIGTVVTFDETDQPITTPMWSNDNWLINSNFEKVKNTANQSNYSVSKNGVNDAIETIDNWKLFGSGSVTVDNGYLSFSTTATYGFLIFFQTIPLSEIPIYKDKITVSMLSLGKVNLSVSLIENGTDYVYATDTPIAEVEATNNDVPKVNSKTFNVTGSPEDFSLYICVKHFTSFTANNKVYAIKIESGEKPTLAYLDGEGSYVLNTTAPSPRELKIAGNSDTIQTIQADLATVTGKVNTIETTVETLETTVAAKQDLIADMTGFVDGKIPALDSSGNVVAGELTTSWVKNNINSNTNQITNLTQTVTGKQDKLTGTQSQIVGFDESGNAVAKEAPSGGGASYMPNLLINPDMTKNRVMLNPTTMYGWSMPSNGVTFFDASVLLYPKADGLVWFQQQGTYDLLKSLQGQTITLSVLYKAQTAGSLYLNAFYSNPTATIFDTQKEYLVADGAFHLLSITFQIPSFDTTKTLLYWTPFGIEVSASSDTTKFISIYGAKFEINDRQTLCKENPTGPESLIEHYNQSEEDLKAKGPAYWNENIVPNADFRFPINTLGNQTYTNDSSSNWIDTIDCWQMTGNNSRLTVANKVLLFQRLSGSTTSEVSLCNKINYNKLTTGDTYTLSCYCTGIGTNGYCKFGLVKLQSPYGFVGMMYLHEGLNVITFKHDGYTGTGGVGFWCNASFVEISAVKFEKGNQQTLWDEINNQLRIHPDENVEKAKIDVYNYAYNPNYLINSDFTSTDMIVHQLGLDKLTLAGTQKLVLTEPWCLKVENNGSFSAEITNSGLCLKTLSSSGIGKMFQYIPLESKISNIDMTFTIATNKGDVIKYLPRNSRSEWTSVDIPNSNYVVQIQFTSTKIYLQIITGEINEILYIYAMKLETGLRSTLGMRASDNSYHVLYPAKWNERLSEVLPFYQILKPFSNPSSGYTIFGYGIIEDTGSKKASLFINYRAPMYSKGTTTLHGDFYLAPYTNAVSKSMLKVGTILNPSVKNISDVCVVYCYYTNGEMMNKTPEQGDIWFLLGDNTNSTAYIEFDSIIKS